MYDVNYHKADSVADAASKLSEDAQLLSGGQTLIPTMKARLASPDALIDVSGIAEMKVISNGGGSVTIGAAVTHAEVAGSDAVASAIPALAALAGGIGDPAVRHRGTIGGSVANNDPAADYPAACLGLGATIITNNREIAADDFFVGLFETALEDGEIITGVRFPVPAKAGYAKFPNPASRYALVGVMVAETDSGVRVAVTGAGEDGVHRSADLEAALSAEWSEASAGGVSVGTDGVLSDMHGDASYRAHLVTVMAKRAVAAA
ncbi:MAG: xanthine dehydrogenase family protein subunit M [Pseudomonadota bacterium]